MVLLIGSWLSLFDAQGVEYISCIETETARVQNIGGQVFVH